MDFGSFEAFNGKNLPRSYGKWHQFVMKTIFQNDRKSKSNKLCQQAKVLKRLDKIDVTYSIDLHEINEKIEAQRYDSLNAFLEDIRIIAHNCCCTGKLNSPSQPCSFSIH